MENIIVDLLPKGERPVLHVAQFDNARSFFITLQNNGVDYGVPEGVTVELRVRKVDGHVVTIEPDSISSNICQFTTTEQMCACYGHNIGEIALIYLGGPLCSILIDIEVQRDVLQGGVDSASDIYNFETQITDICEDILDDELPGKLNELVPPIVESELGNYYTKSEVDIVLSAKADASDVYTKDETDTLLSAKANADDVYTKTEIDNRFAYTYPLNADYIPFIEGIINGTFGFIDLGSISWTRNGTNRFTGNSVPTGIKAPATQGEVADVATGKFITTSFTAVYSESTDKTLAINTNGAINIVDKTFSDAASFKTSVTGVYLVYELTSAITPTITQVELDTIIKSFNGNMVNVMLKV